MEETTPVPSLPPPSDGQTVGGDATNPQQSKVPIALIAVGIAIVIIIIAAVVFLLRADLVTTAKVRDLFIIFMALESLVIGVALVILIVQLATLINLLQNEVRPIITSTNETVNTLKGTVTFLSENLTEPVIKLNSYMAGFKQFFDIMTPSKKKKKTL